MLGPVSNSIVNKFKAQCEKQGFIPVVINLDNTPLAKEYWCYAVNRGGSPYLKKYSYDSGKLNHYSVIELGQILRNLAYNELHGGTTVWVNNDLGLPI